jgi:hypothetical protein
MTEQDAYDVRGIVTMVALAKLMRRRSQAAYWRAAGQHLARLHHRHSREFWLELIRDHCGLSSARSYELIAIARGKKTLAEVQKGTAERVKKHSKNKRGPY